MNNKTFINSRGQATFLPKYFLSSKYLIALNKLKKVQKHIDRFNEKIEMEFMVRAAEANLHKHLPAHSETVFLLLEENRKQVDSYGSLIWITASDVLAMFKHLGLTVNVSSVKQAFQNISCGIRDDINRQFSKEVEKKLQSRTMVYHKFPVARKGRQPTALRFK